MLLQILCAQVFLGVFLVSAMMHWATTPGSLCQINHSSQSLLSKKNTIIYQDTQIFSLWAPRKIHCEK